MSKRDWKQTVVVVLFYLFIGIWLFPLVFVTPFTVLKSIAKLAVSGKAPMLTNQFTVLVPMALGMWYLFRTPSLRRNILARRPLMAPAMIMAAMMVVITKLTEYALHWGLVNMPQRRWAVTLGALLILLLGRLAMSAIFARWPARRMVPY